MPSEEFSAFRLGGLGSCHVLGSNKFALRIFRVHFAVNSVLCMGFVLALSLSNHKAATIFWEIHRILYGLSSVPAPFKFFGPLRFSLRPMKLFEGTLSSFTFMLL